MFLGQVSLCICIEKNYFDLKGSETDATGIIWDNPNTRLAPLEKIRLIPIPAC